MNQELKTESKRITNFNQIKKIKENAGILDQHADKIYEKIKFSIDRREVMEGNVKADELVVRSALNKLELIGNMNQ